MRPRSRRARRRPGAAVRGAEDLHPGARVRGRPPAAGVGDQPRRLAVPGTARALPGAQRHDPPRPGRGVVSRRRHHRAGEDRRAVRGRGARPGRRRRGGAGRDHRGGRPGRGDDRRDARRSRRPAPAATDARRRAVALDDDRHQHGADVRPGRRQAHRAPGEGTPRSGSGRQRLDPRPARRSSRSVGGPGPRRAAAGRAGRDDAPRGVRAHGRQAAGGDAHDRRQAPRAGGARGDRRARGVPGRHLAAARAPQGPHGEHGQPRHRAGSAWSTWSPRAA